MLPIIDTYSGGNVGTTSSIDLKFGCFGILPNHWNINRKVIKVLMSVILKQGASRERKTASSLSLAVTGNVGMGALTEVLLICSNKAFRTFADFKPNSAFSNCTI
ncbi:MAG: hypothetical protein M9892_05820 [Bacteroidetes bacterium]|nr:hypothetical protein [Bacteroidota bacterium]